MKRNQFNQVTLICHFELLIYEIAWKVVLDRTYNNDVVLRTSVGFSLSAFRYLRIPVQHEHLFRFIVLRGQCPYYSHRHSRLFQALNGASDGPT